MWTVCITSIRHVLKLNGYGGRQAKANEKRQRFKGWETLVNNKRAKTITTNIQQAQKAVAKEVKKSPQTAADKIVSNVIESQGETNKNNKTDKR